MLPRVTDLFALHGKNQAKQVAISFPQNPELAPVTYAQFASHMNCVAGQINANKTLTGRRIATLLENSSPHTLSTMFGIAHSGACLVPLNASLQQSQIKTMLLDSDSRAVITSQRYSGLVPRTGLENCRRIGFDFQDADFEPNFLNSNPGAYPETRSVSMEDEFNIIYSSGTTAQPKGIVQSNANRLHWAWSNAIGMRYKPTSRALTTTALYSNGTFLVTIPTLFTGATLYVQNKFDARETLATIARERITHTFMVPTQLKMCLDVLQHESFDLSSLEMLLSAGSMLNSSVKQRVLKEITPNLFELFGCSEGLATLLYPEQHADKFSTVGRPLFGNEVRICSLEETTGSRELTKPNEEGEICFRGPGLMLGYNNIENKAEDWWTDPLSGQTYFRTGDVGKIDQDGFLSILERKKDLIISGGFNVYPKDIEDVILQHPSVQDAAVIPMPHEKWGETPLALVVPRCTAARGAGTGAEEEEIKEWVNAKLSKVQRLSQVRVLPPGEHFPRNVLGKLMKKELRAKYLP